jgi:hypothetical protein
VLQQAGAFLLGQDAELKAIPVVAVTACDKGRRGAHPGSRLRGLFVEAGPGAPVHRNHPPLFRSRPEHSGPLAAASNSQLVVAPRGKEALNAKLRPGCS